MDLPNAFFLFARAEVEYDGRASSTLALGNYGILRKPDGSIQIHGADLIKPLNYMGKATISWDGDVILARSKKEKIRIRIFEVHHLMPLEEWSDSKIRLTRTEAELRDKIAANPEKYLGISLSDFEAFPEFKLNGGPVDIVFFPRGGGECLRVVEVKRNKIVKGDCYQLQKYMNELRKLYGEQYGYLGYVAAPRIIKNGRECAEEHGYAYVHVDF
jgi:hypothetical protein